MKTLTKTIVDLGNKSKRGTKSREGYKDEDGQVFLPPLKHPDSWKKKMRSIGYEVP